MAEYAIKHEPLLVNERIVTRGVDWGPGGIIMVYRHKNFAVVKVPGHNAWTGNYSPWAWQPTSYAIVELFEGVAPAGHSLHEDWGYMDFMYKTQVEPGHGWRKALKELTQQCIERAEGTYEDA
jgi:hypothetical protein